MPEAADALRGLKALGILAPILHPPHARTWKMTQTQGPGGVIVPPPCRASPALWGYKHPCRFPIVVSCSSASLGTVSARPVATACCSTGFRRGRGAVFAGGPAGRRAAGWEDGRRRSSACQDASAYVFLVAAEGCLCCPEDDTMLLA